MLPISAAHRQEIVVFDSLFTRVSVELRVKETNLVQPLPLDYASYRDLQMRWDVRNAFAEEAHKGFKQVAQQRSSEGIAIDVPFKIKSKAFRRIFGGDNIGLRVQGNITIDGKLRRQKFDEIMSANQRDTNTNFNIDMTQRFTIAGKIGEKVQVDVNQDSERLFDFENSLKLTYTGDKDEIVQKVEAGNVNLSLGTRLATFSGQNKGLFGIKTEAKVGALKVTGIASLERGQKNRQEPNKDARRATWTENDFLQNVYFWLTDRDTSIAFDAAWGESSDNTLDIVGYRENYRHIYAREHRAAPVQVTAIEVWESTTENGSQQGVTTSYGVAVALDSIEQLNHPETITTDRPNSRGGMFRKLTAETDYTFEPRLGYIRLKRPLGTDKYLACAFRLDNGDEIGRVNAPVDSLRLVLLRSNSPNPSTDLTWNLMFRHVYSVQSTNVSPQNFEVTIIREAAGGSQPETGPDSETSYLEFFGFDTEGPNGSAGADDFVDNYGAIMDWTNGEMHFLDLTPFFPSGYYDDLRGELVMADLYALQEAKRAASDSTTVLDSTLYTRPPSQIASGGAAWKFQTKSQGSTSQYDLGPLVLEGSEEVTLNGVRLARGSDYTIDYLSGQLKILNEAAKAPNANLVITYESGQVFQLDRKTLLGARAEYELWENSYVGGMVLKLDEKSLDRRVRIGNEPISNTLYDINSQLKFKPNFLTTIVDRLPLIKTNVPSELTIDGEVAKVFPNPNSLSSDATGDRNGVAFLDDFEASRRSTPLGILRKNWTVSSIPVVGPSGDPGIDSLRGRFRWWNPVGDFQVHVKDVFPERETNSQVADRLQSLVLEFYPDSSTGQPDDSWGGVMRYLGSGYEDQSRSQYLEFWIQLPGDPEGRLVVDFGTISEDALPNDSMDSEDKPLPDEIVNSPQREYGNGVLSPDEDTGLDGWGAQDPDDIAFWNGPTRPAIPSYDDWQYSVGTDDYDQVNGTENSRNDEAGNIPDSEDLNGNQNLDKANDYFSYDIELSYDSPYIVGGQGNDKNWRLFRIPLDDETIRRDVGAPSLTNVRWARMYVTGMTKRTVLQIVQNDIVSNEWLPEYVDVDSTEFISAAVINNHENPGYLSPPGVQGELDPITNLRQREQSLALKIVELGGSSAPREFFLAKNLYQQINLIEYKRMKMFIHGGGIDDTAYEDGQYQVILRLGSSYTNTRTNYYEIVKTVYRGWDPRNVIDVAMNDLSILRKLREDATGDSTGQLATRRFAVLLDSLNPALANDSLVINGTPSLQNVGFIALGVRAMKHDINRDDEIWVDELRVSDIYKDPGLAGEVSATLKIADLLTVAGSYNQQDADFHNVNERTGRQNSSKTLLNSMSFNAAKIGVDQLGFSLPVTITRSESESVPKYIPNTDVRVDQSNPDSTVVRKETRMNYTASYSKTGNSPNPLVRWSLERLRLSWDHSTVKSKDYQYLRQEQTQTGARADYAFPTARGRGVAPIWFLKHMPLLSELGNPHFYIKPKSLAGTFSAQRSATRSETRLGRRTDAPNFGAAGSASIGWDITETISTGLSQSFGWTQVQIDSVDYDNDARVDTIIASAKTWKDLVNLSRRDLNQEGWNWTNTYSPQLGNWFSPTFNYGSTYTWNSGNRTGSENQTVQNSRTVGGDVSLDFKQIFGAGGGRRPGREQPKREPEVEPGSTPSDSTDSDSTGNMARVEKGPGFSPLKLLGKAFWPLKTALLTVDPIQVSYDNSLRHNQNGLKGGADLPYRLGMTQSSGAPRSAVLQSVEQNNESRDYMARSGLRVSRDIRTTASWSRREQTNNSNIKTGSVEQSYFWLPNDSGASAVFPFADLTVDWSGLERISVFSKVARAVSLTSGLSSKFKEDWQNEAGNVTLRNYTRQWSPLIGVNVTWLNDLDTQVRINAANSLTQSASQGNTQRSATRGANATVSYTMRTGFRLPILWLGAMRLQNQTTLSLNVDYQTKERATPCSAKTCNGPSRRA
ncbi:MAG: cell surface protein SprA [bacterium]|nr:cell surface protein SprA [bacterium]